VNRTKYGIFSVIALAAIIGLSTATALNQESSISTLDANNAKISGHFTFVVTNEFGEVTQYAESDNLVVAVGNDCMGDLVFGTTLGTACGLFDFIAIGTGSTAPVEGNTAMETPIGGCARVQDATVAGDTATPGEITVTIESTFSGATCASAGISEAGVFDALTTGNLMARSLLGPVTLGAADSLTVTYNIKIEVV